MSLNRVALLVLVLLPILGCGQPSVEPDVDGSNARPTDPPIPAAIKGPRGVDADPSRTTYKARGLVLSHPKDWKVRVPRAGANPMVYHPAGTNSADAFWTFDFKTSKRPQTARQIATNLADALRNNGEVVHDLGSLDWPDGLDRAFVLYELKSRGAVVRERAVVAVLAPKRIFTATESTPPTKWSTMAKELESITRSVRFDRAD